MFLFFAYINNAKEIRLRDIKTNPIAIITYNNRVRIINFYYKIILSEIYKHINILNIIENIKEKF